MAERPSRTQETLTRLRELRELTTKPYKRRFHSDFTTKDFLGWPSLSHGDIKFETALIEGAGHLTQLIDWCNDNCEDVYVAYQGAFYFKSETDAAFCAMVWK